MAAKAVIFAALATTALAGPVRRGVDFLDQAAFEQAQQRDDTATRAYFDTSIKTADGRCLFVDQLSGDASANITPIQVAACGSTTGQGWDVITKGKHINVDGVMLLVNTLTQACATFDAARDAAGQVMMFSCGGAANGTGYATTSQLFAGDGSAGPLSLVPGNQAGSCLTVTGNALQIATCDSSNTSQSFTFAGNATSSDAQPDGPAVTTSTAAGAAGETGLASSTAQLATGTCSPVTVTERVTETVTATAADGGSAAAGTTTTTTVYVIVDPSSSTSAQVDAGSTTTVYQTVTPSRAASAPLPTTNAASAAPTTPQAPADTATIPRISINPQTTVTLA